MLACDGPVTYDGAYVHLDGVELDYVHQERRAKDVPLYIGATGMQMMRLAGEIADGAVLNYLVSPAYNDRALAALAEGAARAGRALDDIDRPQLVVCSLSDDRDAALDAARLLVTQYLGQQPHIMAASGVPDSLLDEIGAVLTWPAGHDEVVAASKLVPDEIVQMLCAAGTADECRAKVAEYVATGCTSPILYPLGDVDATLEAFAPREDDVCASPRDRSSCWWGRRGRASRRGRPGSSRRASSCRRTACGRWSAPASTTSGRPRTRSTSSTWWSSAGCGAA